MASKPGQPQPAQLGATFYPGGVDDFYMPEVVSPAPQRIMPEVPEQIQDKIAHLEIDDNPPKRLSGLQSPSPMVNPPGSSPSSVPSRYSSLSSSTVASDPYEHGRRDPTGLGPPTFSPFPPLPNRPPNVPPSDAQREAILENARLPVLSSRDPEMQLTWAQDTLAYVEVAAQNAARDSESLGARPQTPRIEHQLRVDAMGIVSFLAEQQHPKADFIRGMWLEFGKFHVRMDKKEAYRCYARAAQKGYARAEYRMGMQFESSNDMVKAIKHYTLGVEAGDSASHYVGNPAPLAGMMSLLGQHGQLLDYERGIRLITFAAETADENAPQGAYVLGMLQAKEIAQVNVPEQYLPLNTIAARFNIEKAAYLGFAKAQTKMGAAYELCQLGCDFDPALSLHYNALAARQGEPEAEMAISKWFLCGYDGIFEKNDELAFTYARRATKSGLATAEFAMGYFFEIGIYVPVDLGAAKMWYNRASEHGNQDASARIDGISRSKTLSRKDHENVAIAKIQSQHGSQRGQRPERFKNNPTPMPTIADSPITMPDPHFSRSLGDVRLQQHAPMDAVRRPASTAPYPVDSGLETRPRPPPGHMSASSYSHPGPRPPPDHRQPSGASMNPDAMGGNYRTSSPASMGPSRLPASPGGVANGRGRGTPVLHAPAGVQGSRFSGAGAASPQTYPTGLTDPSRPQSVPVPGIDIGYSAPPDLSGADRKRRVLQKADNSPVGALPPLAKPSSFDPMVNQDTPRLKSVPHARTFSGPNQGTVPGRRPGLSNIPHEPLPHSPGIGPPSGGSSPVWPAKTVGGDQPLPATPASTNTSASRPPGKGPQTFEEMGVPQVKKDSECVRLQRPLK